jgi:hypothetical protein
MHGMIIPFSLPTYLTLMLNLNVASKLFETQSTLGTGISIINRLFSTSKWLIHI